jgi:hypothetical protein
MRNHICHAVTIVSLAVLGAAAASAQPRTYPTMRRGIPPADYQYRELSRTLVALSSPMVAIQSIRPATVGPNGATEVKDEFKVFQLPVKQLELNDRKISRVAFMVHRDGTWSLSLRGDFHDRSEALAGPYFDAHHRRCQFRVKVNCFGFYAISEDASNSTTGKPVVLDTPPIEFWVQSGEPYDLWRVGMCKNWDDYTRERVFELMDRVEIEFAYYHPAGYTRVVRDVTVLP